MPMKLKKKADDTETPSYAMQERQQDASTTNECRMLRGIFQMRRQDADWIKASAPSSE
jgi:hypothetical protein